MAERFEDKMTKLEDAISVEEFVTALVKVKSAEKADIVTINASVAAVDSTGSRADIEYAYGKGWLQEQDVNKSRMLLIKKQCARIVHEFLRCEQKEPDELDSGPAGKLQDLFDCRVCAGHVMQVYVKGIMEGYKSTEDRLVFGMDDVVTAKMAKNVIQRVFHKEKRISVKTEAKATVKRIGFSEAVHRVKKEKCLLLDVRTEADYQNQHLDSAIHYPMMEILKNPYGVCEYRDRCILLYCDKGYMSEVAAQSLAQAGYEKVFYFALETENGNEMI